MKLRFWGVRGSIPTPGKTTVKYGGNTTCLEIRGDKDELLIIDAGTGIKPLGEFIMKYDAPIRPLDIKILLSHTHWDHIQGFPFFEPVYLEDTKITIYGPVNFSEKLEDILVGDFNTKYFPVKLSELKAKMEFKELQESNFKIGKFKVSSAYLNHPILDLGYRIQYQDKVIVTMFVTEPFRNTFVDDINTEDMDEFDRQVFEESQDEVNKRIARHKIHAKDADLLVYDSQYEEDEYYQKIGWGHSYYEYAVNAAKEAKVKKLALFHHDPNRNDRGVDEFQQKAIDYANEIGYTNSIFCARERLEVTI